MSLEIQHDTEQQKFTATVDGGEAYLVYAEAGPGKLDYRSTWVPTAARGQGVAVELVEKALDWAREEGLSVVPSCSFVAAYMDAHPEHEDLRADR